MTIRTLSYAVAIACSAGFSAVAAAQSNSVETITVTGSRSPITIDKLAASVTVLTEQEIQASGATQVTDLLRGLPGISISFLLLYLVCHRISGLHVIAEMFVVSTLIISTIYTIYYSIYI